MSVTSLTRPPDESPGGASVVDDGISSDATPVPPAVANRHARGWGCAIVAGLFLLTPTLVFVCLYAGLWLSGRGLASRAIAEIRADGDPMTAEEMHAYYPESPEFEEATGHWLSAMEICPGDAPGFLRDAHGLPYVSYTSNAGAAEEDHLPLDLARARRFFEIYGGAVEEAHAARRAGAVARFPLQFDDHDDVFQSSYSAGGFSTLGPILQLHAELSLAEGDVDAAVEDLLSLIAASESLTNEPLLTSQFIRGSLLSLAARSTERAVARGELSDEQLSRLQAAFARQDLTEGLRRGMRGDQWFLAQWVGSRSYFPNDGAGRSPWPVEGGDLAKSLELWHEFVRAGDAGMFETLQAADRIEAELDDLRELELAETRYPMTLSAMPSSIRIPAWIVAGQANARLAETGIACERYRLARGDWPAALDDLVPEYLAEVPLDPFDRRPLRYVVDDQGPLLYSVGVDRVDDGGVDDLAEGDLTFRPTAAGDPAAPASTAPEVTP